MLNDMLEACRLCMCRDKDNMKPIFDQQSLATKIMWISDLKMFAGDNLPGQICQQCYVRVNSAFYFKEQIIGIDRTLREMMGQNMDTSSEAAPSTASPGKSEREIVYASIDDEPDSDCYEASNDDNLEAQEIKIEAFESVVVDLNSDGEETESTSVSEKPFEEKISKKHAWNFQKRKKTKRRDRNFLRLPQKPLRRGGRQMAPLKCPICMKVLHSNLSRHVKRHYEEGNRVNQLDANGSTRETPDQADVLETMADPNWVIANSVPQTPTDGRIDCPICGKVVTSSAYLKMHMHSHNMERSTVQCPECPKVFYNLGNLRIHINKVHAHAAAAFAATAPKITPITKVPPTPKVTPTPKLTPTPKVTPPSAKASTPEPDEKEPSAAYPCNRCSGIFSSNSNLRNHVRAIHDFAANTPSGFNCEMCELTFSINSALQIHVREVHNGAYIPKPYSCNKCPLTFAIKASLLGHLRIHTREKISYSCNQCDKSFPKIRILSEHRKTHTPLQVMLYPCNLCDKSFAKLKFFEEHRKNHDLDKRFKCNLCGRSFYEQSSLVRHLRISHDVSAEGSEETATPLIPKVEACKVEESEIVASPVDTPEMSEPVEIV